MPKTISTTPPMRVSVSSCCCTEFPMNPTDAPMNANTSVKPITNAIEWAITRRYMTLETVAAICDTTTMDPAKIAAL